MISRQSIVTWAALYTVMMTAVVALLPDPPFAVVLAIGWLWFNIGRAWDKLPVAERAKDPPPIDPPKWGR